MQFHTLTYVGGELDSYSQHIDFGNLNILMQYNYSEDNEGGFCQILGDNMKSTYRYNISVNDGFRVGKHPGKTIGLTDYTGNKAIRSDSTYIYGNTIFLNNDITTEISLDGLTTFIYNNIFYKEGFSYIGINTEIKDRGLGFLKVSNNLYYGKTSDELQILDTEKVVASPSSRWSRS